jgi:hypothetical protein
MSTGERDAHGSQGQPSWFKPVAELFRVRGYLTLSVRIGYDTVLIVSGPGGEAAIVDLSRHPTSLWNDAWTGMRQVLPRVPVVAIVPESETATLDLDGRTPLIRISEPVQPEEVVRAVDQLLSSPDGL